MNIKERRQKQKDSDKNDRLWFTISIVLLAIYVVVVTN